jgi:outer membrane protein OmpA-like peptidoglycan-associated protein
VRTQYLSVGRKTLREWSLRSTTSRQRVTQRSLGSTVTEKGLRKLKLQVPGPISQYNSEATAEPIQSQMRKGELLMKTHRNGVVAVLLCLTASMLGCSASNAVKGGAIGVGGGAVVGGIIGKAAGNTALGAIIGAAVGGTTGAIIGNNMDKRAEEMRKDLSNAKVERVGEGIKITFDSGILFVTNSSELQSAARANIEKLSRILNKYQDTNILIEGDTDNEGTEEYNQRLSERRAQAVADYQKGQGVAGSRISTIGLGELNPVASNETAAGRQQNRRVEVAIFANEKMKDAAENGELN